MTPRRAATLCAVLVALCPAAEPKAGPARGKPSAARLKGMKAALADLEKGVLKKEYPPLPYSLQMQQFIRLLKSECGVQWEVVGSRTDSKDLREQVEGYNDVMRVEIEHRFGRDVFRKLHDKARKKAPPGVSIPPPVRVGCPPGSSLGLLSHPGQGQRVPGYQGVQGRP